MLRPAFGIGLRQAPNDMVGRDGDARRVLELLGRHRLVTLLGSGGLGKTRLAQDVAARAVEAGSSVAVVELASIASGDDVGLLIASTLGYPRGAVGAPHRRPDRGARRASAHSRRPRRPARTGCAADPARARQLRARHRRRRDLGRRPRRRLRGVDDPLHKSLARSSIAAEQVYSLQPLPTASDASARRRRSRSSSIAPARPGHPFVCR